MLAEKLDEDWTCSSRDMLADRQIDRQKQTSQNSDPAAFTSHTRTEYTTGAK